MAQKDLLEKNDISIDNEIDLDKDFVIDNSLKKDSNVSDTRDKKQTKNGSVDIENIFERANSNVKEATNIFQKNLVLKQQLEEKIKQFNIEKSNFEKNKQLEYDKIKEYRKTAYEKLQQKN